MSDSHSDDDGVIGYQATTVTPAMRQPIAAAALPSIRILPAVSFIRSTRRCSCGGEIRLREVEAGLERRHVKRQGLLLLPELAVERLLHLRHLDPEQVREHAVVDHVAHETPQPRVGTHGRHDLVERHRVKGQVGPERLRASSARRRRALRRTRASARPPSPSPDSARRRGRFPSCGRCTRACWRGWCTTWAGPRCSTGTGSCPTPGCPSGRWSGSGSGWRSGCRSR